VKSKALRIGLIGSGDDSSSKLLRLLVEQGMQVVHALVPTDLSDEHIATSDIDVWLLDLDDSHWHDQLDELMDRSPVPIFFNEHQSIEGQQHLDYWCRNLISRMFELVADVPGLPTNAAAPAPAAAARSADTLHIAFPQSPAKGESKPSDELNLPPAALDPELLQEIEELEQLLHTQPEAQHNTLKDLDQDLPLPGKETATHKAKSTTEKAASSETNAAAKSVTKPAAEKPVATAPPATDTLDPVAAAKARAAKIQQQAAAARAESAAASQPAAPPTPSAPAAATPSKTSAAIANAAAKTAHTEAVNKAAVSANAEAAKPAPAVESKAPVGHAASAPAVPAAPATATTAAAASTTTEKTATAKTTAPQTAAAPAPTTSAVAAAPATGQQPVTPATSAQDAVAKKAAPSTTPVPATTPAAAPTPAVTTPAATTTTSATTAAVPPAASKSSLADSFAAAVASSPVTAAAPPAKHDWPSFPLPPAPAVKTPADEASADFAPMQPPPAPGPMREPSRPTTVSMLRAGAETSPAANSAEAQRDGTAANKSSAANKHAGAPAAHHYSEPVPTLTVTSDDLEFEFVDADAGDAAAQAPTELEVPMLESVALAGEFEAVADVQPILPCDLWVLGASLGGPAALKRFFTALNQPLPICFLLAQHIDAHFLPVLGKILEQANPFYPVQVLVRPGLIEPGSLLLAPIEKRLRFLDAGQIVHGSKTWTPPYSPCIDDVLTDVAIAYPGQVHAIVFSGMGEDGVNGASAVANCRGDVWVQDADSCASSVMPDAIDKAGLARFRATPEELAARLMARYNSALGSQSLA
jgi:chemotaxis response regulator CheB